MWELTDIKCYNYCHMLALQNKGYLVTDSELINSILRDCCFNNYFYRDYNIINGEYYATDIIKSYLNFNYHHYEHNTIFVYRRKE